MTPAAILVMVAVIQGQLVWDYKFYKTQAACEDIALRINLSGEPVRAKCIPDREI